MIAFPPISKIGRRLVIYILLFSSLVTLVLTAIQIVRDYRIDIASINLRIDQMGVSDAPSLSNSLWVLDLQSIGVKLDGLSSLRDMQYLEISKPDGEVMKNAGERKLDGVIERSFPLTYYYRDREIELGTLYVQASLEGVYQRLLDTVIIILVSQATKTFIVSLFILLIVHYVITRHLISITEQLSDKDISDAWPVISLDRDSTYWSNDDEIDQVIGVLNEIHQKLWKAYQEISEHKDELEDKVADRTYELEYTIRELNAFAYSVSHDLRAPLRSIHGFSEIMMNDYESNLDADGRDILQRIMNASVRMSVIIDDLLSLSLASRNEIKPQDVDVSDICDKVHAELQMQDPDRSVEWVCEPDMHVWGDRNLLTIALQNLIQNAWKYTGKEERPSIECGSERTGSETIFFIRDNGAGFNMQYRDKLFQPFHRLHGDKDFEGTGIGLAIVERVFVRHHGRVWARSAPGEGAVFYFFLPGQERISRRVA